MLHIKRVPEHGERQKKKHNLRRDSVELNLMRVLLDLRLKSQINWEFEGFLIKI